MKPSYNVDELETLYEQWVLTLDDKHKRESWGTKQDDSVITWHFIQWVKEQS